MHRKERVRQIPHSHARVPYQLSWWVCHR